MEDLMIFIRKHLFFSSLILLFPLLLSAWTTPVNISNTDSLSSRPAMCIDKRGWLHVVWEDRTPGNYDIYYTFYNKTAWADTQNVSHGSTCWRPDVSVDTLNRVHVVWGDYDIGKIMWTMLEEGIWTTPVSISDSVPYSCVAPELDVNHVNNHVHCVWHNLGNADIWHSFYNSNTWSIPENVTNDADDSIWPDVVLDSLGRIHVVWQNVSGGGHPDSVEIFYSIYDSITWTLPVNISTIIGGSVDPRISIDKNNNPRVTWEEGREGAGYEVYYTYFDGINWVNPSLVDTNVSRLPAIAVDKENKSHLAWGHGNGIFNIFYTIYIDTIREFPPEDASNTDSTSNVANLAIDSQFVHLVWGENLGGTSPNANVEIYYSKRELSGIDKKENNNITFSVSPIVINNISFSFSLPAPYSVYVSFYDVTGKNMKEAYLGFENKGTHQYNLPLNLSSGIYFSILKAGTYRRMEKFILLNP